MRSIILNVIILSFVLFAGCSSSSKIDDIDAFLKPNDTVVTTEKYFLMPPDEIEIHCLKVPEINLQKQQIRPDGYVTFESLGSVYAAGKTPEQLANDLRMKVIELYALSGDNPIDIQISTYQSNYYYVLGEVEHPGPKLCTGRVPAFTAIASANPTILAWNERIRVIRPSNDVNIKPKVFELDFKKMMTTGDTSRDVLIQQGDIIYVPPTILASIGKTVQEITTPINSTFSTINVIQRTLEGPASTQSGP
ncbi:MAG: polysaccharide biosynthesis/export family protein [Sedimentisphaerales bacterium]|nr:polysaccharide biosynthesis/export family protein [Sedimentisphaerales bacterium]